MPDYEDLAFKPAMSWDELKESVKDKVDKIEGNIIYIELGYGNELMFKPNKVIEFNSEDVWCEARRNVSYERMKNIIDNLYGE